MYETSKQSNWSHLCVSDVYLSVSDIGNMKHVAFDGALF